jgi:folate-binding protein YgfZ
MTDAGISAEYRIISTGAGWIDRSDGGRLRFEGADAGAFLQNLVSNDLSATPPGRGVYATLLTPTGRLVSDLRLFVRPDAVLAGVAPGLAAPLAERFDSLVFAEDVRVRDVSVETAIVTVLGARAAGTLAAAFGLDPAALENLPPLGQIDLTGGGFAARADETECAAFDLWLAASDRDGAIERLTAAGAARVSESLFETLRVEAGRPLFGRDMTSDTIPLEAGLLDRAISTTKGCYVGQEVIIRVLHRGGGRVAKRLARIALDPGVTEVPAPGAALYADGKPVGAVTSAAYSPRDGRAIALGYVARDVAEPGRRLTLALSTRSAPAEITGLAG